MELQKIQLLQPRHNRLPAPRHFRCFQRSTKERGGGHGVRHGIYLPNGTAHPQPGPGVYPEGRTGCGYRDGAAAIFGPGTPIATAAIKILEILMAE